MVNFVRAMFFALSLKKNLLLKGEVVVEFDSTQLANATLAALDLVAPFKFSVGKTGEGYLRIWKLDPIW
jgi:hypothetical protein